MARPQSSSFINKYRLTMAVTTLIFLFLSFFISALGLPGMNDYNPFGTVNKLSYYTTQTIIFAALWFSFAGFGSAASGAPAGGTRGGRFLRWAVSFPVQTAVAIYLTAMVIVFGLFLGPYIKNFPWYDLVVSTFIHYIIPGAFLFDWIITQPDSRLKLRHLGTLLIYPFLYGIYILTIGFVTGWYPYPMMDVQELGDRKAVGYYIFFLLLFSLIIGIYFLFGRLKYTKSNKRR